MKDSGPKKTAHVVSHTHWDREWRYPIWETRLMLVDFMDELVEVLESGKYPGFLLDGQVSPVLDYLEIRPEMTDRIRALVSSGKLEIGPWFVLPDEYPVDGEAMIRNLLCGYRHAEALGGVFSEGYTPFGFRNGAIRTRRFAMAKASTHEMKMATDSTRFTSTRWKALGRYYEVGYGRTEAFRRSNCRSISPFSSSPTTYASAERPCSSPSSPRW